ncbi:TetR/AcrR family transcriptional regulator [Edaphobacter sp. 12200R-103]|jgi:TetR/AcrR family transcriptional repressor of nem operon|uniref:TetR/AcrR family transcriptional regulator n=1 Tax=Edaphobacter sp. 12200R-103 TaxID=2703788 RepID=UPI00138B3620|nr:TetR/AcrR family transcriptional regulator [Edaphobacter sp. 12200R-103]QHS50401.1 TetR/AcrR family transcriptional regulator [Edaphobacter sp. 12200R-103]
MSKGDETRQKIIAAAAPLFNKQGYAGCVIKDIMAATGLEKGGIYRHFESKEEIAAEAFDYAWMVASATRQQGLDDIPNHVDRLKQHISRFVTRSSIPGGCPLLNTGVDSDNGNPILRERVRNALKGWQKMLRLILVEGIEAGTVRGDVDPEKVSRVIISGLEGGMLVSRIEKNDEALRDAMDYLDSYLETNVRAPQH